MDKAQDLFEARARDTSEVSADAPLALRMRPQTLQEFVGQQHVLGEGKLLRRLIDSDRIASLILYGPPGTGKSALAWLISRHTAGHFESLHAAAGANVAEVKKVIAAARQRLSATGRRTILFIDEIHRFNKAQQDVLLHDVEQGTFILIAATTHNPFFYVIPALISRSQVFEFKTHTVEDIESLLQRALQDKERGLGNQAVDAHPDSLRLLAQTSDGDARRALNALEVAVLSTTADNQGVIHLTPAVAAESMQKKLVRYDRDEDDHYNIISAFIKSMRGSDPDAAVYWLAKMLYSGEDPRFVARRIVICAAEDVGNADPQALILAQAAFSAVEQVGMPEARIILSQATVYVACAPKSNAAYLAIEAALSDVESGVAAEVPSHLKDASYRGAKTLGHGEGYIYAHTGKDHYVKQNYGGTGKQYYEPGNLGYEKKIREWLSQLKKG